MLLVFVGSYTANGQIIDLMVTLIFGVLSYFMVLFGWPRPPFVLGFVLGKVIETYLFISMTRYGFSWLTHPIVMVFNLIMAVVIAYPYIQQRRQRERVPSMRKGRIFFCVFLITVAAYAIFASIGWSFKAKLFPLSISIPLLMLATVQLLLILFGKEETNEGGAMDVGSRPTSSRKSCAVAYLASLAGSSPLSPSSIYWVFQSPFRCLFFYISSFKAR